MPFLGDIARLLGQQGGMAWDSARQLAMSIATDGTSEPTSTRPTGWRSSSWPEWPTCPSLTSQGPPPRSTAAPSTDPKRVVEGTSRSVLVYIGGSPYYNKQQKK